MNVVQVWNPQPKEVLRIEFMIGNTCNFSCWYCFEGSHEGTHRWTDDMDQLVLNFKHLFEKYKAIGKTKLELHIVGENLHCGLDWENLLQKLEKQYLHTSQSVPMEAEL